MEKKFQLKNTTIDMIHGPIFKSIVLFAIPILISSVFQQLYNTMDTFIVGRFLGDTALAAIGSVNSVFDLINGFALGIGNGLAIVTARAFGSGDQEELKKSVAGSLVIGLASSILITILAFIGIKPLMHAINVPNHVFNQAYSYIIWIILFLTIMFAYNLAAGLLRAIGNSVMPLLFLIFSSLLNVGLDILFITQFHLGVAGAAIATVIAQGISVLLCIIYIIKKTEILIPQRKHFTYDPALYKELLGQGYAMAMQSAIVNSGSVILQSGINNLGADIIAGHTAARKLYMFCNMPFTAMGQGIATFISQNTGAQKPKRIRRAMRDSYLYDLIVAIFMTVFLGFCAPAMVSFISSSHNPTIVNNGSLYLRIVAPNYAVLGVLMQTRSALQGIGQKILPLISSVIEFFGKILFVIAFIPKFKYMAVIFCEPTIWIVMTIYLLFAFWRTDFVKSGR
ncbi:MAG: MATE family efflux transporter [Intestinibaculum porci]|uniref:MATE family efflux transporter n=1 Tax=Intestinibaculum porci TaxID=2487118 RepID=UPI002409FB9A|nr:MATE family efflux transporter [Intestinibaculum porci]MDD6422075.1 MATE family efflux transporter [Intestinibaculum porci]